MKQQRDTKPNKNKSLITDYHIHILHIGEVAFSIYETYRLVMVDAVAQFTNLHYNIVNLLSSVPGRQLLENPAWYTSQKRIVVRFIKTVPESQGLFCYYPASRNLDTPVGYFLFCFQNFF